MQRRTTFPARTGTIALLIAGALLQPAMTHAQIDRSKAPEPGPAPEVTLGRHSSMKLPNGMRLIVVEDHDRPLISVQVKFDVDPFLQGDLAGYTDLAGDLLGAGTRRRTKAQIDEEVDQLGARFFTSSDGLYGSALKKRFPKLMELVYEVTTSASFPPDEFEKAKNRALSGLKQREDDPDAIADQVSRTLAYRKGHPYGEVVTEETLGRVQRKHVESYYKYAFQPERGYVVFVGDISFGEARALAEKFFGTWQGHEIATTRDDNGNVEVDGLGTLRFVTKDPKADGPRRVAIVDRPGAPQSVLRVTFPVDLHPADPRAMHVLVMNTILGGGVFNARLMQNLREDKAFTYGAYCSLQPDRFIGRYVASTSVRTEVTDSALTEIVNELERMREGPVTDEELELTKNYLAGSFARSLEDPRTVARFALRTYLDGLPEDHYRTYLKRLDAVTKDDVLQAAQTYLHPDHAALLVVGDKEALDNRLVALSGGRGVVQLDMYGDTYRENLQPAPAGMTPELVIDRYLEAVGGKPAIAGIQDLRTVMTASMQGMPVQVTQYFARPNSSATVMTANGQVVQREVFHDARGQRTMLTDTEEVMDLELEEMGQNAHPFPESTYKDRGRVLLSGVTEVRGRKAYKLTLMQDNGFIFYEYYDVDSGLKLRREQPKTTPQGNLTIITEYQDYRPVDDLQFPHLIEQVAGARMVLTVKEIAVNKGVDPEVFRFE